jgi:hypothetical protein
VDVDGPISIDSGAASAAMPDPEIVPTEDTNL